MSFSTYLLQNTWWGKLLGAGLGFLVAGPPGALLGIFIGNLFDRGLNIHLAKPHANYHTEKSKTLKKNFQKATFLTMGHICKSSGRVSEADIQFAEKIIRDLRLSRAERTSAKHLFREGKSTNFKLYEVFRLLHELKGSNPKLIRTFIQIQYTAAQISGLSPEKIKILNQILSELQLAPLHEQAHAREAFYRHFNEQNQSHYQSRKQQNKQYAHTPYTDPNIDNAYALLNISKSATQKEVKRAYRKQISLHHPDKHIAKGQSETAIKQANEKTQAIRKAYELITEHHGW